MAQGILDRIFDPFLRKPQKFPEHLFLLFLNYYAFWALWLNWAFSMLGDTYLRHPAATQLLALLFVVVYIVAYRQ